MAISKSVQAILSARDQGFTSTFRQANGLLGHFGGSQSKVARGNGGMLKAIKSTALGMSLYRSAAKGVTTALGSVRHAMARSDTLYLYRRNITELTGSASQAEQALQVLSTSTTGTAYGLDTVANATQTFANSNLELKKSGQYATRFMDLVSRYGDGTNATYERVMVQMGKMGTRQKANLGDIRSAVEANIPVWSILSKATGQSVGQMQADITAGKWTAEQFFDTLMLGSANIEGAAKDSANTWSGAIGIMRSRMTVGMTGILEAIKTVGAELTGKDNGIFLGLLQIGSFARDVMLGIAKNIEGSIPYLQILKNAFREIVTPIKEAISAVINNLSFMNQGFNQVGAIQLFKGIVDRTKNSLINFANFVNDNSEAIGKFIGYMPQAVMAISSLRIITKVGKKLADFGHNITDNVLGGLRGLGKADAFVRDIFIKPIGSALVSGGSLIQGVFSNITQGFTVFGSSAKGIIGNFKQIKQSANSLKSTNHSNLFEAYTKSIMAFVPETRNFLASVNMIQRKIVRFGITSKNQMVVVAHAFKHPIQSIGSLKNNITSFQSLSTGLGLKVGLAFKKMAMVGVTAIKSLSLAMLSNPVTAALVGITAAVAVFAVAWKGNVGNVQGATKSVFSGLKRTFSSTVGSLKQLTSAALGPVAKFLTLENAVKLAGISLAGGLTPITLLIDGFRGIVMTMTGVINVLKLGTLHFRKFFAVGKERRELSTEIKAMEKEIKSTYKGLADDSATKAIWQGMSKLGEVAQTTAKSYQISAEKMGQDSQVLSERFSHVASEMEQAFNLEDSTAGMTAYVASSLQILERFNQDKLKTTEKYSELMQQAEQAQGDEKIGLMQSANELILSEITKNNRSMMSLYQETSEQLISGKNAEGESLTAEQKKALAAQNEVIRAGLIEQNELFVQATMNKVALGERLSQQEQRAAESNLKALYTNQAEQITSNEQKIADLRSLYNDATTQSQKDNFQAEIDTLKLSNEGLLNEQRTFGEKQLALMLNGNEMTAQTVIAGLAQREEITGDKLADIFQHFVNSNTTIADQLALLGGIMEREGFEGADKLAIALKSGDLAALGESLTEEMKSGIAGLPEEMFWQGEIGQKEFIRALEAGQYERAGKFITSSVDQGLSTGEKQAANQGDATGQGFATGVTNQQGAAAQAGATVANASVDNLNKKQNQSRQIGSDIGENYSTGLKSQTNTANRSGQEVGKGSLTGLKQDVREGRTVGVELGRLYVAGITSQNQGSHQSGLGLTNQALAGARRHSNQSQAIGLQLAAGIASGIRAGTGSAVSAMANLVSRVNQEAEKRAQIESPSKVTTKYGQLIAAGFPTGLIHELPKVLSQVRGFVDQLNHTFYRGLDQRLTLTNSREFVSGRVSQDQAGTAIVKGLDELKVAIEKLRVDVYLDTGALISVTDEGLADHSLRESRRKW